MGKDYYSILGVSKGCSDDALKKAYRKLAMKWHPDKHPDPQAKKKAEEMFKDIAEAYDVLSDGEKRRVYDKFGEEGLKGGGPNVSSDGFRNVHYSGVDPEKIFSTFFGSDRGFRGLFDDDPFSSGMGFPGGPSIFTNMRPGFGMGGGPGPGSRASPSQAPKLYQIDFPLSLEELYTGTKKKLKVTRTRWNGSSSYKEDKVLEVDVKAGWKDGTKIKFAGEGDQENADSRPGDMSFVVKTKPHERFVRDGPHLIHKVTIPLSKALSGFIVPVITLDNRRLEITVDEVVNPKTRKIVANEGMPSSKTKEKGDLILEFDIIFPRTLTSEQKTQLKRILG